MKRLQLNISIKKGSNMNQLLQTPYLFILNQGRSIKQGLITMLLSSRVITKGIIRLKSLSKVNVKAKSHNYLIIPILSSLFLIISDYTIASDFPKENLYYSRSNLGKEKEGTLRSKEGSLKEPEDIKSYKRYKKSHKDQHRDLTVHSRYVKGDFCPLIRWVSTLDCYYGSKRTSGVIKVPSEILETLGFIGNHIKACCEIMDMESDRKHSRNILVPYMSYISKSKGGLHQVSKGNYLHLGENKGPLAFVSGPYSYPNAKDLYTNFIKIYGPFIRKMDMDISASINLVGGSKVSEITGKDYNMLNNEARNLGLIEPYNFHTEEWFHEILNACPSIITDIIKARIEPGSKVCSIIFDIYSWQDACEVCQIKFKKELFQKSTIHQLEVILKSLGLRIPRNGIKVVYRILSEKPYYSDMDDRELTRAGGGYSMEDGFDIKAIGPAQVALCARKEATYPSILEEVQYFRNTGN